MKKSKPLAISQHKTIEQENCPAEIDGFKGQDPTIHGDWQHKGRVTDF